MIAIAIILLIINFLILCYINKIATELEKTRLENREIINVINKALENK